MSLTFRDKSNINRAVLSLFRKRLVDKEVEVIPPPGVLYYGDEPANRVLMGTLGAMPNPEITGVQAPNAMGMVLMLSPDNEGVISFTVSGQFDISHRSIPEFEKMHESLKYTEGEVKPGQSITQAYRKMTVVFEDVHFRILPEHDENEWVKPQENNPLNNSMQQIEAVLQDDPTIYKRCHTGKSGAAKVRIDWNDDIVDQESLNEAIAEQIFVSQREILSYKPSLRARVRPAPPSLPNSDDCCLLEIYLENTTSHDEARAFGINRNACFMDVRFEVALCQGTHHELPHKLQPKDYRYKEESAVAGYGITTSVSRKPDCENVFVTDAMPVASQTKKSNPSINKSGMEGEPSFESLSKNPLPVLRSLIDSVSEYANDWQNIIDKLLVTSPEEAQVATEERAALLKEAELMKDGVDLLEKHEHLLRAFCLMNCAMRNAFMIQKKNIHRWRLFQIGFILTQIRAVYERGCPDSELTDHIATAEVLWFATGGGKTEAYLGLITMCMLYERMSGRYYGVTAWMKFPLRMLSVQQFQRLSYVVAQANKLRQEEKLGGHPFTIGYYTGAGTPNNITSKFDNDIDNFLPNLTKNRLKKLQFIHDCPYCEASNSIEVRKDLDNCRIKHVCTNSQCWSNRDAAMGIYGEGIKGEIGIYVSDEEVYRYVPSVMVGTIDRLAVIAHNKRFRVFFGKASHYCPNHGFTFAGSCQHYALQQKDDGSYETVKCPNNSRSSTIKTHQLNPMVWPGIQFVLQDELHLLSENTGNFDAHYETLIQTLQQANNGRVAKIVSATATIKGYKHHINHLYQRNARRFPAPGINRGESFYSRIAKDQDSNETLFQRWYAGILPIGSGQVMEKAAASVSDRFLQHIDDLVSRLQSDKECVCRELGIQEELADDVTQYFRTYLNASLIYNNSMRGNSDISRVIEQQPNNNQWITLDGDTSLDEIQNAINHVEQKFYDDSLRQLLATSVVSHGVDMHRLNFMVVAGWPKTIAEYMQSSARAGRSEPGIVLSVLNSKSLFQNNVFMDFEDYHLFMERMVETVPVNRFSPNLLSKTLPGIFNACVLNWLISQPGAEDCYKNAGKLKEVLADPETKKFDQMRSLLISALSVPEYLKDEFDHRVTEDFHQQLSKKIDDLLNRFAHLPPTLSASSIPDALEQMTGYRPMFSLRDIESQVRIKPYESEDSLFEALARGGQGT